MRIKLSQNGLRSLYQIIDVNDIYINSVLVVKRIVNSIPCTKLANNFTTISPLMTGIVRMLNVILQINYAGSGFS